MPTPWPSEWLRGLMEVCVLRAIADGPTYGYAIATALERGGLGAPKGGTLYPLLARLEKTEKVRTHWGAGDGGPGRKFYELTDGGRAWLDQTTDLWESFHHAVTRFLVGGHAGADGLIDQTPEPPTTNAPHTTATDPVDGGAPSTLIVPHADVTPGVRQPSQGDTHDNEANA